MNEVCYICNSKFGLYQRYIIQIFEDKTELQSCKNLYEVLSEITGKPVVAGEGHSNHLCKKCHKMCVEYDNLQVRMNAIKLDLLVQFKTTLTKNNLIYETFGKTASTPELEESPIKTGNTPKKIGRKLVLPASKLQKLPPNFVIDITKVPGYNKDSNVPAISKILPKHIQPKTPAKLKTSSETILPFSVVSLPRDFMSPTSVSAARVQDENEGLCVENNDDHPMEIDEECSLGLPTSNINNSDCRTEELKDDATIEKSNLILDMLQEAQDDGNKYVLDPLADIQIMDQKHDYNGSTIVMEGNGSMKVVSVQKFLYGDNEFSLILPNIKDDDSQDSNEESQIELQVSGDEETAQAIIAAAQEKGGAFIKVESGEMFRVESVQSKAEDSPDSLDNIIVSEGDKMYKCMICARGTEEDSQACIGDADFITAHVKTKHHQSINLRVFHCSICGEVFILRQEYITHIESHGQREKSKTLACPVCSKTFNSSTTLSGHACAGARPHSCSTCGKRFASKYTLHSHLKTHEERPRPYKCHECNKSFFTPQNLAQHVKIHTGIKDFICKECNKAFLTAHNLATHALVHSRLRPHACRHCGKTFARRAELRDHERTHTGERPYPCETCGARFSQRSNLLSHRRATHLDDRRHACQHCPKRFKRRRLLLYHIKASHTGERPLVCSVCRATFVYPEHYKKHMRIHSGERPYSCEVCGKTFNSRDNRNSHRFVHSDKKPYECLVCGAGYMRKQLLYAHMNTTGHLAESIVVNQPRVQTENVPSPTDTIAVDAIKMKLDSGEDIFDAEEMELNISEAKPLMSSDGDKVFLTSGDRKIIIQDGKLNVIDEGDEQSSIITLDNMDADMKTALLNSFAAGQIEQSQLTQVEEPATMMRLVQIQMADGNTGWVALNPE